jgi:hypothetical protein
MKNDDLTEKLSAFEERMAMKRKDEEDEQAANAEKLRQDYLKRTGRKEMEP